MNDIDWWVWALIVIAVVAAIVVGVRLSQRARIRRTVERREQAAALRDDARGVEVEARAREAEAATIRAEADQARVEAEQLESAAVERERAAAEARGVVEERLAEADRIDPDVTEDVSTGSHVDRAAVERPDPAPGPAAHAATDRPPTCAIDPDTDARG